MAKHHRTAIIVNPRSANGRTGEVWPELEAAIRDRLDDCLCATCARPGHATELTREALLDGYDRIVSVGGDGTHNEVINGFFDGQGERINPEAVMAILPQGTASDFAKTLEVDTVEEAIDLLTDGRLVAADVGRVTFRGYRGRETVRHFLNVAHFGLGGAIAKHANDSTKAIGGSVPYFLASLKTFYRFPKFPLRIRIDDEELQDDCINVIVANGKYFGGGVLVTPEARFDNGRFEIFVVGNMSRTEAVAALTKLYGGRLNEVEKVQHFRGKKIEMESKSRVLINLDGEQPGRLPARVELAPGAIKLLTGKKKAAETAQVD